MCPRKYLLSLICSGIASFSVAQTIILSPDSTRQRAVVTDTSLSKAAAVKKHSPKKATILSAVLPGAGQIYNQKYWKVGVIAAGTGALIYGFNFNRSYYKSFKGELIKRQRNLSGLDPALAKYSSANLLELQDVYRRNSELTVIGMALLYALNVLDATVDANLFEFDVQQDLSVKLYPGSMPSAFMNRPASGLGINFRF